MCHAVKMNPPLTTINDFQNLSTKMHHGREQERWQLPGSFHRYEEELFQIYVVEISERQRIRL